MKILALEFSSEQRSVAVLDAAGNQTETVSEVVESGGRSTKAFGLIEAALREASLEREQIECLAIGLGPGSYTGVRAGISLAQGWQLAREVRLLGVSSAECIAAQAHADGLRGRIAVLIDAQRNEFYMADYDLGAGGWQEVKPLRLATGAEVAQVAGEGPVLLGPEVTRWFPGGRIIMPRAGMLAKLASTRRNFVLGEKLEPIYLRETKFVKAPPPRIWPASEPAKPASAG
jgi:tRNA threonylcarbamoyl adenosine modification protein YeaZ